VIESEYFRPKISLLLSLLKLLISISIVFLLVIFWAKAQSFEVSYFISIPIMLITLLGVGWFHRINYSWFYNDIGLSVNMSFNLFGLQIIKVERSSKLEIIKKLSCKPIRNFELHGVYMDFKPLNKELFSFGIKVLNCGKPLTPNHVKASA